MKNRKLIGILCIGLIAALVTLSGCQAKPQDVSTKEQSSTLKIARQFGLAYAPLTIMENKQFIEKHSPETTVEWVQLGNTAAIREAILTDSWILDLWGFLHI